MLFGGAETTVTAAVPFELPLWEIGVSSWPLMPPDVCNSEFASHGNLFAVSGAESTIW